MIHFYNNTCLNVFNILSLPSGGIVTSSTNSYFTILSPLDLVTVAIILFLINLPALWITFLKAVYKESSPVSNKFFSYFLAND